MFKPISGLFGQVHVLEKWPNMIKLNYFRGGYLLNTGYTMASYGYSTDVGKAVTARQSVLYNL